MSRLTESAKTSRVRTGNTLRDNPVGLAVAAPLVVAQRSQAAEGAASLATLAGALQEGAQAATGVLKERNRKGEEQALLDYNNGVVNEDSRNAGYLAGAARLRGNADLVLEIPKIREQLLKEDLDSMTDDEVQARVAELITASFGGVDKEHPEYVATVAAGIQAFELQTIEDHRNNVIETAREEDASRLAITLKADYEGTGEGYGSRTFNYEYLHSEALRQRDRPDVNPFMADFLTKEALDQADPSIIDNIPDAWPDGTPTLKSIPKYAEALRSARDAAQSKRDRMDAAKLKEEAADLTKIQDQTIAYLATKMEAGDNGEAEASAALRDGHITYQQWRNLNTDRDALNDNFEKGVVNDNFAFEAEQRIRNGEKFEDVVGGQAYMLGSGTARNSEYFRLQQLSVKMQDDRLRAPEVTRWGDVIKAHLTPVTSNDIFGLGGTSGQLQADRVKLATAQGKYVDEVLAGKEPAAAYRVAMEYVGADPKAPLTAIANPAARIQQRVLSGELTEEQAIAELSNDL